MSDPFDLKQGKDVQVISFSKLVFGVAFGIIMSQMIVGLLIGLVYLGVQWSDARTQDKRRKANIEALQKELSESEALLKRLEDENSEKDDLRRKLEQTIESVREKLHSE